MYTTINTLTTYCEPRWRFAADRPGAWRTPKRSNNTPCLNFAEPVIRALGHNQKPDAPILLSWIIESGLMKDPIWCLRAVAGHDREKRLFAVWCAKRFQHLMTDQRSLTALGVAERYVNNQASADELKEANKAARLAEREILWHHNDAESCKEHEARLAALLTTYPEMSRWTVSRWNDDYGPETVFFCVADRVAEIGRNMAGCLAKPLEWYKAEKKEMDAQHKELLRICANSEGEGGDCPVCVGEPSNICGSKDLNGFVLY